MRYTSGAGEYTPCSRHFGNGGPHSMGNAVDIEAKIVWLRH
jgi:hypothetical protein